MRKLPSTLALLFLSATLTHAVDLSKIERTVKKHPFTKPEQRDSVGWVLLVFGEEAKTRMWVAVNGQTMAQDRNFDGDLTDDKLNNATSNNTFELGPITDPDTKVTYKNVRLRVHPRHEFSVHLIVPGKYEQSVEPMPFGKSPETAPIVHLDGPLTVGMFTRVKGKLVMPEKPEELAFYRSQANNRIVIFVGTPNYGTKAMPTCVMSCSEGEFREHINLNETFYPKAIIELPNADPKGAPHRITTRIDDD